MEAYSLDLRQRVLAACDAGQSTKQVAIQYEVSPAWVRRLKQRRREDGTIRPRPILGAKPKLDAAAYDWLMEQIRRTPDATLEELRARIRSERGIIISIGTLWSALRKRKLTFKKSRCTPPSRIGRTSRSKGPSGTSS